MGTRIDVHRLLIGREGVEQRNSGFARRNRIFPLKDKLQWNVVRFGRVLEVTGPVWQPRQTKS